MPSYDVTTCPSSHRCLSSCAHFRLLAVCFSERRFLWTRYVARIRCSWWHGAAIYRETTFEFSTGLVFDGCCFEMQAKRIDMFSAFCDGSDVDRLHFPRSCFKAVFCSCTLELCALQKNVNRKRLCNAVKGAPWGTPAWLGLSWPGLNRTTQAVSWRQRYSELTFRDVLSLIVSFQN